MADQRDGRVGRPGVEQRVEVREIVREPVAVRGPFGAAESAPVGRDERVPAGHGVDQELERVARVHPAVQQHDDLGLLAGPAGDVVAQAPHHDLLVDRGSSRLVGLRHVRAPHRRPASIPELSAPLQASACSRYSCGTTIPREHAQDPRLPARRLRTARPPRPAAPRIRLPHPLREFRPRAARRAGRAPLRRSRGARRADERGPVRPAPAPARRDGGDQGTGQCGQADAGICLGAQLLAAAMGGDVRPNTCRRSAGTAAHAAVGARGPAVPPFRAAPALRLPVARLHVRATARRRAARVDAQLPQPGLPAGRERVGTAVPPGGGRGADRALARERKRQGGDRSPLEPAPHRAHPRRDRRHLPAASRSAIGCSPSSSGWSDRARADWVLPSR